MSELLSNFGWGVVQFFGDPLGILLFVLGLMGGFVFGTIPGITALTLGAVLLPFTAYLTPTHAIMLYAVIYVSGVSAGGVTAILFNIPGDPEDAPTAFDGYPLTRQGKAPKAVGMAVTCSAIGGTASALVMIGATQALANWAIRAFGPPEIFALIFFGLSVAASVGAGSLLKGWLSVLLGLLLATVGPDPAGGLSRFAFGTYYLLGGIQFVPLILGFFGVTEVLVQGEEIVTQRYRPPKVSLELPRLMEFWRLKLAIFRSFLLGFFAGILPGIGATLAAFLSYSEAVRWSRHPERFGKGELEGVAAAETAKSAATGGAMIPLLALGLPGGALTAMMLAIFQIHGMELGPEVMTKNPDLVWVTFVAMLFANFCILLLGYLEAKTVVHFLRIPFRLLGPIILLFCVIGAYALRNLLLDVWVMFAAGILGYLLRRTGYSVAGIVLGVILGDLGEAAFVKSMQLLDYDVLGFFLRPISAILLVAGVGTIIFNVVKPPQFTTALASGPVSEGGESGKP